MLQHQFLDNQLVTSSSSCLSQRSELVPSELMCLLKWRQIRFRPLAKFLQEAMSYSQQKGVTENLVGKEVMVNPGCLEELAEMLLKILKLLSVINPSSAAVIPVLLIPTGRGCGR